MKKAINKVPQHEEHIFELLFSLFHVNNALDRGENVLKAHHRQFFSKDDPKEGLVFADYVKAVPTLYRLAAVDLDLISLSGTRYPKFFLAVKDIWYPEGQLTATITKAERTFQAIMSKRISIFLSQNAKISEGIPSVIEFAKTVPAHLRATFRALALLTEFGFVANFSRLLMLEWYAPEKDCHKDCLQFSHLIQMHDNICREDGLLSKLMMDHVEQVILNLDKALVSLTVLNEYARKPLNVTMDTEIMCGQVKKFFFG